MREKIRRTWQSLTIKKKIATFTGMVFLIISLSVLFDIWVVRFSLVDFNGILQDNAKCSELVQALEEESELFEEYIKNPNENEAQLLETAMSRTKKAVYALPFVYSQIGEERYAKTWSIRNSYEVYCDRRNELITLNEDYPEYIGRLYEVYDMQGYLKAYARSLMNDTIEAGDSVYQKKIPMLASVPIAVIVFGIVLFWSMMKLAALMNKTIISPVLELVHTAQKIAANNFFVEDVVVENQDELGELALSSLFRYNLKTPQAEVPLVQELKVVADYMYLQQMRFGSRIDYKVDCQVNEELVMVPTFTFQPLVENAIIHGLSPKEEGGTIRIRIWQRGKRLYITVGDNGAGMEKEQLIQLKERLCQEKEGDVGIGLGNVYRRICAMYQGSIVEVYSRKNAGTVIRIDIPQNFSKKKMM